MLTNSENIVTQINLSIFYKEFTFDKNEFCPAPGHQKELADNVIFLDDLLFIIQIKERNPKAIKTEIEENKWFSSVVLNSAKNQIKDSVKFFKTFPHLPIQNRREHVIDVSKANLQDANKLIIYSPNSLLINETNRFIKFYESKEVGNIHIFHIEDYYQVCKHLLTPTELDEYLKFRERIYLKHKNIISICPEQYILAHFLHTDDEKEIDKKYIEVFKTLSTDTQSFNLTGIFNKFFENMLKGEDKQTRDYYEVLKEIVKLKRAELAEFKKRFELIIQHVENKDHSYPYRFVNLRTACGFVFIPLMGEHVKHWENALINFTKIYKYKRQLDKCVGVIIFKNGEYFDIYWAYIARKWEHDAQLENEIMKEADLYEKGSIKLLSRFKI